MNSDHRSVEASTASTSRNDVIDGLTRFTSALLGIVVLYAAVVLSLFPEKAALLFAWNIQPAMNAAFMGAAYANGVVFFAAVLTGRHWHRVAAPHLGVFVFSTLLLIATFLHWGRFNHGHPVFWAWIFIYSVAPILVPITFFRNRRADPLTPETRDAVVPLGLRIVWGAVGIAFLLASLVAFVNPSAIIGMWPWKLTPLTARVVVSFYAILGAAPLTVMGEARWSAWRVGVMGVMLWHGLLLFAALRRAADFPAGPTHAPWFWAECAFLLATVLTFLAMESRVRRTHVNEGGR